jgi:hypothetical protein
MKRCPGVTRSPPSGNSNASARGPTRRGTRCSAGIPEHGRAPSARCSGRGRAGARCGGRRGAAVGDELEAADEAVGGDRRVEREALVAVAHVGARRGNRGAVRSKSLQAGRRLRGRAEHGRARAQARRPGRALRAAARPLHDARARVVGGAGVPDGGMVPSPRRGRCGRPARPPGRAAEEGVVVEQRVGRAERRRRAVARAAVLREERAHRHGRRRGHRARRAPRRRPRDAAHPRHRRPRGRDRRQRPALKPADAPRIVFDATAGPPSGDTPVTCHGHEVSARAPGLLELRHRHALRGDPVALHPAPQGLVLQRRVHRVGRRATSSTRRSASRATGSSSSGTTASSCAPTSPSPSPSPRSSSGPSSPRSGRARRCGRRSARSTGGSPRR